MENTIKIRHFYILATARKNNPDLRVKYLVKVKVFANRMCRLMQCRIIGIILYLNYIIFLRFRTPLQKKYR